MYYQLPNKLEWYKDIVAEAKRRNISMKVICDIAGIAHISLKYNARDLAKRGIGISYEALQALTDALNGLEGNPKEGGEVTARDF